MGRTYEAIIRVNSQSGKGGVAYLMDAEHGLDLPRALQIEFSKQVQAVTEASGTEIKPGELWDVFTRTYLPDDAGIRLISSEVSSSGKRGPPWSPRSSWTASTGRYPAGATVRWPPSSTGFERSWASTCRSQDYHEHALTAGSEASAVAYVEATGPGGDAHLGRGHRLQHPRRLAARR